MVKLIVGFAILLISTLSWSQRSYNYLALGDSYTIGESVEEKERWPNQLVKSLSKNGYTNDTLITIAQTGWRTDQMLNAAKTQLQDAAQFDLVSLLIGVNNEFQGRTPSSFKSEFKACLDYAIKKCKNGKSGVFVLSIPDYGYTPFGKSRQKSISKRLDAYNAICQSVCKQEKVRFIDITPLSRRGLQQKDLVAADGLHPSAQQYALWVEKALPEVIKLLSN